MVKMTKNSTLWGQGRGMKRKKKAKSPCQTFLERGWKRNKSDGSKENEVDMLHWSERIEVRNYHVRVELNDLHRRCDLI